MIDIIYDRAARQVPRLGHHIARDREMKRAGHHFSWLVSRVSFFFVSDLT